MAGEENIAKTGTPGLDELFAINGFKRKSSVLVSGEPGAGKSILAMQYIYNGARLYGEGGVLVTSEQSVEKVRETAAGLGMDFTEFEESGMVKIIKTTIARGAEMLPEELAKAINDPNVSRVVIDSLTPFEFLAADLREFRVKVLSFLEAIAKHDITLLVTAEKKKTDFESVEFSAEDFLFDGLVLMGRLRSTAGFERVVSVIKMRGTSHSEELHPIEITDKGLVVKTVED